ncbi:MAG TPA: hypothetical protein H9821_04650 [Candidatus Rothia avicola]|uniref:Uncharacterized protein n=1 Tax=Candidatus Rothia avicola TaxID=2840478 RepID=A0A9D1ZSD9_9MICC|nr:hypothetical protein [Candidatus Rothia avicola]
MLPGTYKPGPVIEATLRIYVNGIERPHASAKWGIDTAGGMPESLVNAGTDIRSRRGSITWAPEKIVSDEAQNPAWHTLPAEGDKVEIIAEVAGQAFPRFTGFIETTKAPLDGGEAVSEITDGLGVALTMPVNIPPWVTQTTGGGSRSVWMVMRCLELAGRGHLPADDPYTVAHDSYQFRGFYSATVGYTRMGATNYSASTHPYGLAMVRGMYTDAASSPARENRPWVAIGRVMTSHGGSIEVTLARGQSWALAYAQGVLKLYRAGSQIWEGKSLFPASVEAVPLVMEVGSGRVRIWTDFTTIEELKFASDGAGVQTVTAIGGLGVSVRYSPNASYAPALVAGMTPRPAGFFLAGLGDSGIRAMRGFENEPAEKVVASWCEATMGSVWADETGKVIVASRPYLMGKKPSITDKVQERVFTGAWATARDPLYSGVSISYLLPNIRGNSAAARQLVYQPANIQEITPGEEDIQFIQVPDLEDWHEVDTSWRAVVDAKDGQYNSAAFNAGSGSFWQITFEQPDTDGAYRWTGPASNHEDVSATLEKLGQRTLKMTHLVRQNTRSRIEKYYLATPTLGVEDLRRNNRGVPAPLVRAKWLVQWAEMAHEVTGAGGSMKPRLSLDTAWWLTPDDVRAYAQTLATELATARITFDSLSMLWDPRKQVGDTCLLAGEGKDGITRWEAEYIITGYTEAWEGNVPTWSCDAQAKWVRDPVAGKTYGDFTAAYARYDQWRVGTSYADLYDALPGKA